MKILVIGPSETGSRGGMAAVIRGIRESSTLNGEFDTAPMRTSAF